MSTTLPPNRQPIAIVGIAALFPGSTDATGFWRDILEGRDLITDVPASHWLVDDYFDADPSAPDKTYARRGGFLDPIGFDALGFGVPPSTMPATDTSQLLALILAQTVLQDALRGQFETADRSRTSVILGVTSAQELLFSMVSRLQRPVWVKALRESGLPEDEVQAACERIAANYVPWQESSFPGLLGNVVAGRIANRLNLGGTNCVTDAACASALSAISMAISELQLGTSDLVISGGVDTLNDIFMYMCFSKTPALSPTGDCRPFSDQADGTMLGEGLGMVALKRLADAERDGDRIYAVIRGMGTSSDGRSKSVYAPVPEGQAKALRRAYDVAGYGPETVELMEAHGTGTKAGDAAEFEGLRQVFGSADGSRTQWCALGSVKSQIGHTKAAAGAAGLFKAVMALHHKVLPPGIKIDAPNPKLALETSPFYLNTRTRPWIRGSAHPRRASVSAFGFGGSNFHMTLEEYTGTAPRAERLPSRRHELVVLGAADAAALVQQARALATSTASLATIARDSQASFKTGAAVRLAFVAGEAAQLQARLLAAVARIEKAPAKAFSLPDGTAYGFGAAEGELALLFPGQGSQFPHMGADLAVHCPQARAVWDRAADLALDGDAALHDVVFPRPAFTEDAAQADLARLTQTQWAQPAIGATSLSMLAVLDECGVRADRVGGHSFGELVALHAAGVYDQAALLRVARRRGELMAAAAATPGAMTALTQPVARVRELIERSRAAVVVANHNAPQQVVVSGELAAIETFETFLAASSVTFRRLPVASGFHSSVVADSCEPFAQFLAGIDFAAPTLPVYGNANAAVHAPDPSTLRAALSAQVALPVRFVEMVEQMYADGARTFLEVGPGSVLTGLVGAILGDRPHHAITMDRKNKDGVESLLLAFARLVAAGVDVRLDRLFADERAPLAAPSHNRPLTPINGSNVGKPYPPEGGTAALPKPNPPRAARVATPAGMPVTPTAPVAPMPAPVATTPTAAPVVSEAWLHAFQQGQEQIAQAHLAFQRSMFDSHAAYLQLTEAALSGLAAMSGAAPLPMSAPLPAAIAMPVAPVVVAPLPMPVPAPAAAPVGAAEAAKLSPQVPANGFAASAAPTSSAGTDLTALMLEIVAEKTGYPVDMLEMGMDLEGDLGIDSIKRVEILAAVDERAPGLSKLDRTRMAALHTIAEIVNYLQEAQSPIVGAMTIATASPAASMRVAAEAAPTGATAAIDLTALMLQIVAEKTGYPVDMLEMGMDLEGDLGIDSIKRVEILAAVDERAPGLSKLDRTRMAALHTIAEIVGYLQEAQSPIVGAMTIATASPAASMRVAAEAAPTGATAAIDLTALMLQIVAEKTGYPVDMLEMGMDLEGDLGIDSIKRVEILAAVDERAPGLSKLDRTRMAALHTIAEIVGYLQEAQSPIVGAMTIATASPAASMRVAAEAAPTGATAAIDLTALMLQIVAEKTGYPVDMLEMGMDLEGDLGIDSIKRVEILAAVDERAPGLSKLDRTRMAALHTIAEIVGYLQEAQSPIVGAMTIATASPAASMRVAAEAAPTGATAAIDLTALMLQIVAEKTGYPVDMLEMGMDLEGDLGIDSIKRVEILAAVDERAPGLSKLDRTRMAALHTIAEIVNYLQEAQAPGGAAEATKVSPQVPAPTPVAETAPILGRYRLERIAAPSAGMAQPGLRAGNAVWITGHAELGPRLEQALRSRGVDARHVDGVPADASACLYLGGLRDVANASEAIAIEREAFALARQLAATLEAKGGPGREHSGAGLFITVQDTGGAFGLEAMDPRRAWLAGLPALIKTATLEWPRAALKAIDIERGLRSADQVAAALVEELFEGGGEVEVALPAVGGRYTLRSVLEPVVPGDAVIGKDDVVVVSGGARGVTAACLVEWAKQCPARFVLLGRTALGDEPAACVGIADDAGLKRVLFNQARANGEAPTPNELVGRVRDVQGNREIRATLQAIAQAGAHARYEAVDVTDAAALEALLARVRQEWGPVAGVVHAAGVLADKRIAEKTDAQFDAVFRTKVDGLRALLAATAADPLKLLCVFSSVSARCGNTGQADYAMANEVLAKVAVAESHRRPDLVAKSLGWGPWEAGMVSPALKERFAALGVPMIPLGVGAKMFAAEMSSAQRDQVELVLGGEPRPEALLFDGASERVQALEVSVARSSHAYLEGHAINGQPVLPLVLAAEWLTRAARSFRPGLPHAALHDIKVLKGIRLGGFENGGDRFSIHATPLPAGQGAQLQMTIRDAQGHTNYSARVELLPATGVSLPTPAAISLEPWAGEPIYQDLLFHRGSFELIQQLDGISDHGIAATLSGVSHAGWNGESWHLDVAALDAGLQLAVLFGQRMLGGPNLPTGIDRIRTFAPMPGTGLINATAYRRTLGNASMTTDIVFTDDRGRCVAELLGVHNHALAAA